MEHAYYACKIVFLDVPANHLSVRISGYQFLCGVLAIRCVLAQGD